MEEEVIVLLSDKELASSFCRRCLFNGFERIKELGISIQIKKKD